MSAEIVSMSLARPQPVTVEEFLPWAMRQPERYELVEGRIVRAMTGARQSHNVVVSNIIMAIGPRLKQGGCRTTANDMAVRTGPHGVRYPDIVVDCSAPEASALTAGEPRIVFEILSPSTSSIDTSDKLDEYRSLPSVQAIVLVDPNVVLVKLYRREGADWQAEHYTRLSDIIRFPGVEAELSLLDLYDTLEPAESAPVRAV